MHNPVIRMVIDRMVRLIKDQEADVSAKLDIPVAKGIEEDLWRGDHDPMGDEDFGPKVRVFPLFRFHGSGNETNGDGERGLDDESLLLAEGDGRCYKPGYLKIFVKTVTSARRCV